MNAAQLLHRARNGYYPRVGKNPERSVRRALDYAADRRDYRLTRDLRLLYLAAATSCCIVGGAAIYNGAPKTGAAIFGGALVITVLGESIADTSRGKHAYKIMFDQYNAEEEPLRSAPPLDPAVEWDALRLLERKPAFHRVFRPVRTLKRLWRKLGL